MGAPTSPERIGTVDSDLKTVSKSWYSANATKTYFSLPVCSVKSIAVVIGCDCFLLVHLNQAPALVKQSCKNIFKGYYKHLSIACLPFVQIGESNETVFNGNLFHNRLLTTRECIKKSRIHMLKDDLISVRDDNDRARRERESEIEDIKDRAGGGGPGGNGGLSGFGGLVQPRSPAARFGEFLSGANKFNAGGFTFSVEPDFAGRGGMLKFEKQF